MFELIDQLGIATHQPDTPLCCAAQQVLEAKQSVYRIRSFLQASLGAHDKADSGEAPAAHVPAERSEVQCVASGDVLLVSLRGLLLLLLLLLLLRWACLLLGAPCSPPALQHLSSALHCLPLPPGGMLVLTCLAGHPCIVPLAAVHDWPLYPSHQPSSAPGCPAVLPLAPGLLGGCCPRGALPGPHACQPQQRHVPLAARLSVLQLRIGTLLAGLGGSFNFSCDARLTGCIVNNEATALQHLKSGTLQFAMLWISRRGTAHSFRHGHRCCWCSAMCQAGHLPQCWPQLSRQLVTPAQNAGARA
jgi:hypothetical protein